MDPNESASTPLPASAAVPAGPPPLSEAQRLTGVCFSPGETFDDIARNGRWWIPALIIAILLGIMLNIYSQRVGVERMVQQRLEQMETKQQMSPEQREKTAEGMRKMMPIFVRYMPPVFLFLALLVEAAVLMGVFNMLMDSGLRFKQVLNIVSYAGLAPAIVSQLAIILVLYLKDPDDFNLENPLAFNAGAFVDPHTTSAWLKSLLTSIDVFTFWTIALLAIGFSVVVGKKKMPFATALMGVVIPWLLWVLLKTGGAAIFG